jgi:hypothetical protein
VTCLVWSKLHNAWWRHRAAGYTHHLEQAGVFPEDYHVEIEREQLVQLRPALRAVIQRRRELLNQLRALSALEGRLLGIEGEPPTGLPISVICPSTRAQNAMKRAGISTVEEFIQLTPVELYNRTGGNFGRLTQQGMRQRIRELGLTMAWDR